MKQNNEISPTAEAENFDPTFRRRELRSTRDDTEALAEWMGDPPAGFEYKWTIDSCERYRMLKERAYEEHTTRTIERPLQLSSPRPPAITTGAPRFLRPRPARDTWTRPG